MEYSNFLPCDGCARAAILERLARAKSPAAAVARTATPYMAVEPVMTGWERKSALRCVEMQLARHDLALAVPLVKFALCTRASTVAWDKADGFPTAWRGATKPRPRAITSPKAQRTFVIFDLGCKACDAWPLGR